MKIFAHSQTIPERTSKATAAFAVLLTAILLIVAGTAHAQSTVPAAPTGLSATMVSHDSVTLGWDDPGDDSITGYVVLRRNVNTQDPGVFTTIESNTGSAATSYTDSTVSPENSYVYRVKAINPAGTSPQSNYVNVDTPAALPDAPTGLTATSVSHESVTLGWDDPGDDSITGYMVLRRNVETQDPGVFTTINSNTGSAATSYTDSTVNPETRYTYRVKAINPAGTSPQSNYVNVDTPAAPPAAPTGLSATTVSHDSVTLGWDDPGDDSITGYVVQRHDVDTQDPGVFATIESNTGSPATSYTDSTVSAENSYVYRVQAINPAGTSPQSNHVDVTTEAEPPNPGSKPPADQGNTPRQATSTDATLSALTVDGTSVAGFDSETTSYQYGVASTVTQVTVATTTTNSSATVSFSPADAETGTAGHQVDLSAGSNSVTITVTAEDTTTTEEYTLSVNRGVTTTFGWKASDDFDTLVAAGNEAPYGIWSDGTTMWVTDVDDIKIYAYNLSTKARDSSKDFDTLAAAGNLSSRGIWSDGTTMWVADETYDKLYSYNVPSSNATLSTLTVDGTSVTGFASDRTAYQYGVGHAVTQVTVAATTTGHASATVAFSPADASTTTPGHQVDLSAGSNDVTITVTAQDTTTTKTYTLSVNRGVTTAYGWKAADDFDTLIDAGNDDPIGTWSDRDTMWVSDKTDGKIYAYSMSTKARDLSEDFDTLDAAGNNDPTGIWSYGNTMWVADSTDDKLYAYNLSTKARDSSKDFETLDAANNNYP